MTQRGPELPENDKFYLLAEFTGLIEILISALLTHGGHIGVAAVQGIKVFLGNAAESQLLVWAYSVCKFKKDCQVWPCR